MAPLGSFMYTPDNWSQRVSKSSIWCKVAFGSRQIIERPNSAMCVKAIAPTFGSMLFHLHLFEAMSWRFHQQADRSLRCSRPTMRRAITPRLFSESPSRSRWTKVLMLRNYDQGSQLRLKSVHPAPPRGNSFHEIG